MPNTLNTALLYLINTVFDLYLIILVIRIILVWIRADYFNPLVQFIIKCTDFIVKPMRRLIPNVDRLETASVVLVLILEVVKFSLVALLAYGIPTIPGLLLLAIGDMIKLILQTFFYAILVQAILSWIQPRSPMSFVLYQFTSPIMRPLQRVIPPVGGIDISPIPALIILQLLIIVLVNPIMGLGLGLAFK